MNAAFAIIGVGVKSNKILDDHCWSRVATMGISAIISFHNLQMINYLFISNDNTFEWDHSEEAMWVHNEVG